MNTIQKRFILFLFLCIGTRSLFVYIAKNVSIKYLMYLGYLSLLLAVGLLWLFLTGERTTGVEVFGEKIWWNKLRPVHSLLYFLFAYNAIRGNQHAWVYLLIDVILGLFSFLVFHFYNGDFSKLITK
jgi:hypothetical protein